MSTLIDRLAGVSDGLGQKAPVACATTGPVTLSGLQTVDTVVQTEGMRTAVKDQADQTLNGIWNASSGPWTRALDFDGARDIVSGTQFTVAGGTQKGLIFTVAIADGGVIGQTPIVITQAIADALQNSVAGILAAAQAAQVAAQQASAQAALLAAPITLREGLAAIAKKVNDRSSLSFVFEGDSLTYGQDTVSATTRPSAGTASQTRSTTSMPEAFIQALQLVAPGLAMTLENRGYPGDSTVQGLSRWATAQSADVVFVMYGTNDAGGYGGYPLVPVDDYRTNLVAIVSRRLVQGSAVVVLAPPVLSDPPSDAKLQPYRAAAREVAEYMRCTFVDISEQIGWMFGDKTTDLVHLKAIAYNEAGWHLAGTVLRGGNFRTPLRTGVPYYLQDQLIYGGVAVPYGATPAGALIRVDPGVTVSIAGYVDGKCLPTLTLLNPTVGTGAPQDQKINSYYGGAGQSGIPVILTTASGAGPSRVQANLQMLYRGWRTLQLRNDFTAPVHIEAVQFNRA